MEVSTKRFGSSPFKGTNKKQRTDFSKRELIKNLLVLCCSYMMSFCASDGLIVLQSTMNNENGVGVISIALVYACGCLCALVLPKYLIKKVGSKVTIVISMLTYVPFLAANFYPHFSLMIPASIIVGFGSSLVWGSLGTYLNDLSLHYYNLTSGNKDQESKNETYKQNQMSLTKDIPITSNSVRRHKDSILITKPCKHLEELSFYTLQMQKKGSSDLSADNNVPNSKMVGKLEELVEEEDSVDAEESEKKESDPETNKNNGLPFSVLKKISMKTKKEKLTDDKKINAMFTIAEEQMKSEGPNKSSSRSDRSENSNTKTNSESLETLTARFFGIFGLVYQTCHIWSNAISYFTLQRTSENIDYVTNSSCSCGSDFCSDKSLCFKHNIQIPSNETRYILTTTYVLMGLLSALCVALFVDELSVIKKDVTFTIDFALATCKIHKKRNQLLLVPLSLYLGMYQAFLFADYTKDFVGCAWGVNHVALVSISLGCGISLSCGLFGWLVKHLGRIPIFSCIAVLNIAVFAYMLTWAPDPRKPAMMFVVAVILGFIAGTLWCQLRAFLGIVFKEEQEAAFGTYQLWHGLGCAICFAYSNFICTYIKICLLIIVLLISIVGYLLVERNHSMNKDNE